MACGRRFCGRGVPGKVSSAYRTSRFCPRAAVENVLYPVGVEFVPASCPLVAAVGRHGLKAYGA
eukprot:9684398-Prorocentrum_lima.AAC.1